MEAPDRFTHRLHSLFDGRLRIRWSNKRQQWHLEYKVARAVVPKFYIGTEDDQAIRGRDGYAFLMEITRGDTAPCPKCGLDLKVPFGVSNEVTCPSCKVQGRDGRYPMCYFPLDGDALIQRLIELDPLRNYRDSVMKKADAANKAAMDEKEKKFKNDMEAITKDNIRQLMGIPIVGYTGAGKAK